MAHYTDGAKVKVADVVSYHGEEVTVTAADTKAGNDAEVTVSFKVPASTLVTPDMVAREKALAAK